MNQVLNLLHGTFILHNPSFRGHHKESLLLFQKRSCLSHRNSTGFQSCRGLQSYFQVFCLAGNCGTKDSEDKCLVISKGKITDRRELDAIPPIQTLKEYPKEELFGKVVMVRFDSDILLKEALYLKSPLVNRAVFTIKYLYNAGAKVILASNWGDSSIPVHLLEESVADYLSSVLQLEVLPVNSVSGYVQSKAEALEEADVILLENLSKFGGELSNCSIFSEKLASGVDIFVNDAFSQSHKNLASNVGVTRFCYASVAGFHFEENLSQLREATTTNKYPYIAIIGGGHLIDKASSLHFLASKCDGLVFVGMMAFQIMHASGLTVPLNLVDPSATEDSLKIIQLANCRKIPVVCLKDFWCVNDHLPKRLDLFPMNGIMDGWAPVDLGPVSLGEIFSLLSKAKKILCIGPLKLRSTGENTCGTSKLVMMLDKLIQNGCDVTVVGSAAAKAIMETARSPSVYNIVASASIIWEFLRGRKLPGLSALDRAYPFKIDWDSIFCDPVQPLVVDIGSGNGLFLFGMATRLKDLNFLGLDINEKLVKRCLNSVRQSGLTNGYFIATNATSTFRSIVSSYRGKLVLISIQCPNPDFNKQEHRWRMLQRPLIEAISDLLTTGGKVFLQSDIEAVAVRMKEQFMMYGKGKFAVLNDEDDPNIGQGGWLKENPFGIRSDWEQHVINREAPMYRVMISKIDQY
ncbi:phosphoglycerate kinase, cytosolic-like isoform X2 [Macadamia integrifolia]|uniref:phosphoglycerate kinase, cytosolic-like isoform X2 n=1 Tax=Macadamia integrifolia TaxID=60698 RepID=UPI001C4E9E9D|nr:phosphoglycerate kinase, cytosolic-like isoform X2 [Macadamia integrifolia]